MEIAGLVVGAVSLASFYSACLDAINRVESYRSFGLDTDHLLAQFHSDRAIFQRWAGAVGITRAEGLATVHDSRLDEPDTCLAVARVFRSISDVLSTTEHVVQKLDAGTDGKSQSDSQLPRGQPGNSRDMEQPQYRNMRRRDKLGWALRGKDKFSADVAKFSVLVQKLCNLVPTDPGFSLDPLISRQGKISIEELEDLQEYRKASTVNSEALSQWLLAEKKKSFLAWLGSAQYQEQLELCCDRRSFDTCNWIVEKPAYTQWKSNVFPNNTAKFLWIHGPAGFGKTILCSHIVESWKKESGIHFAYYFCTAASQRESGLEAILKAWITQLANREEKLLGLAEAHKGDSPYGPTMATLWSIIETFVRTSTSVCSFVLDGLDEHSDQGCIKQSTSTKAFFLTRLLKTFEGTKGRVLVVSRDEPSIRSQLTASGPHNFNISFFEHAISKQDVSADVLKFSKTIVEKKLFNKTDVIKNEIASLMAEKCEGMFLWIDMQSRDLRGGKNKRQLQKIIEDVPANLDFVYHRDWSAIITNSPEDKARAIDILRWAMFAYRPLTISELTEALIVPNAGIHDDLLQDDLPDEIDRQYIDDEILNLCGSLVEVRDVQPGLQLGKMTLHLKHFSVREFLLKTDISSQLCDRNWNVLDDNKIWNNYLAAICMRFMRCKSVRLALKNCDSSRPFLQYAVKGWYMHLSMTGEHYQEIAPSVNDLFTPGNTLWELWRTNYELQVVGMYYQDSYTAETSGNQLYYAVWLDLPDVVQHLYQLDPSMINWIGGHFGTSLQAACWKKASAMVRTLIKLGADVNIQGGSCGSALCAAVISGDLASCEMLLARGARSNVRDRYGLTAYLVACWFGRLEIVKSFFKRGLLHESGIGEPGPIYVAALSGNTDLVDYLLNQNFDPSAVCDGNRTALHAVSYLGLHDIAELLINKNANLSIQDLEGRSPLWVASQRGHLRIVRLLIQNNASHSQSDKIGATPLLAAANEGHLDVVKLLLDNGADVSLPNESGVTPIHVAAFKGHSDVLKLLLRRSADPYCATKNGSTPLTLAILNEHLEILRLLYRAKETTHGYPLDSSDNYDSKDQVSNRNSKMVSTVDADGETEAHAAAAVGNVEIGRLLSKEGIDFSVANKVGCRPLGLASAKGHTDFVQFLVDLGVDVNATYNDGWSPLHSAAANGRNGVAEVLLKAGANPSAGWGEFQMAPIHLAAQNNNLQIIKILRNNAADLNQSTGMAETALHFACREDSVDTILYLIHAGCSLSSIDDYGHSPLDWASSYLPSLRAIKQTGIEVTLTPLVGTQSRLRSTISKLVNNTSRPFDHVAYVLSRCLVLGKDFSNAYKVCQLTKQLSKSGIRHNGTCNRCDRDVVGMSLFICESCADSDLCADCFAAFRQDETPLRCQSHQFWEVDGEAPGWMEDRDMSFEDVQENLMSDLRSKYKS